ncbi:riboflavin kinase [Microbacterium xanthum]|uniref:riboflavin kinase n=1 Tax=Microbacterium xanthum TaxID=3079794 RepID=UPI002AD4459E|nr:riboflavin kinase [Microbacterium sp. KSW-48]MDZ8171474.1 riboflavin kinase [Microbacterium sp. KSW-48]
MVGEGRALRGVVVHGEGRGGSLGFPTANLDVSVDRALRGVYAARVRVEPEPAWSDATVSIGDNPTFGDVRADRVECHLHDRTGDLYGRTLDVRLIAYLRAMEAFKHPDDLARQAAHDVAVSRWLLAARSRR